MVLKYCCFFLCLMYASGLRFDGPCNVRPPYAGIPKNNNHTVYVNVPSSCRTGNLSWSHPRGHAMVKFNITGMRSTSICIRDSLGGEIFTITDMTENKPIGPIVDRYILPDHWACTSATTGKEIVLKVDGPFENRYMGRVEYKLSNSKL